MSNPKKSVLGGSLFGNASTSYEVSLNLTPLMDVMSNILFFLLAAFGTSIVAVLPATTPVVSGEATDVEKETAAVTVAVRLTNQSINVNCQNDTMTPEMLRPYEFSVSKKGGQHDLAGFTAGLRRVKEKFGASRTMVLAPDDGIPYQEIVRVMDAGREQRIGEKKWALFPDVVLSGVLTEENSPTPAPEPKKRRR